MRNKAHAHFLRPTGCAEVNGGEEEIAEGMEWRPLYLTHSRKRTSSRKAGPERGPCAGLASVVPAHLSTLSSGLASLDWVPVPPSNPSPYAHPYSGSECLPQGEPTCGVGGGAEEGF